MWAVSLKRNGFTLVEMVITIVVIGVGVAGVLAAFQNAIKSSADPMVRKQLIALAEGMMEEITLKTYAVGSGARNGCARLDADDIRDYDNYSETVCSPDGTPFPPLSAYTVSVDVADASGWLGIADTMKITVTVSRGRESFSLVSWRTNYASPSSP